MSIRFMSRSCWSWSYHRESMACFLYINMICHFTAVSDEPWYGFLFLSCHFSCCKWPHVWVHTIPQSAHLDSFPSCLPFVVDFLMILQRSKTTFLNCCKITSLNCLDPFPIYAIHHCTNSRVWTCSWVQVTLLEHSCTLLELQPFNVWACVFIRVEFRSSCVRFALRELMLWNSICICVRLHCTTAFHAC